MLTSGDITNGAGHPRVAAPASIKDNAIVIPEISHAWRTVRLINEAGTHWTVGPIDSRSLRRVQSDVTDLNWLGLVFDELTNIVQAGKAKLVTVWRVRERSHKGHRRR